MVAGEGEKGRGRGRDSCRATTQFYITGSVVMLKPGSETKTRSGERRGMACFCSAGVERWTCEDGGADESESSDELGPVGEKRANRFALRSLLQDQQCASATGVDLRCRSCSQSLHSCVPVLERC